MANNASIHATIAVAIGSWGCRNCGEDRQDHNNLNTDSAGGGSGARFAVILLKKPIWETAFGLLSFRRTEFVDGRDVLAR